MIVNGLPVWGNGVTVVLKSDGTIFYYEARMENLEFEAPVGIISEKKAKKILERRLVSNVYYVPIRKADGSEKIILAYRIGSLYGGTEYIDAKTGYPGNTDDSTFDENNVIREWAHHWAGKDVARLISMRVINYKDGNINPDEPVTRAELAKMLVRASMINPHYPTQLSFTDVPKGNIYSGYIEAALKNGIIYGSEGKFRPDNYLTREEMAVILSRLVETDATTDESDFKFKDSGTFSPWAVSRISTAVKSGLVKGDKNGNFNPRSKVTLGEAAALLTRLIERME